MRRIIHRIGMIGGLVAFAVLTASIGLDATGERRCPECNVRMEAKRQRYRGSRVVNLILDCPRCGFGSIEPEYPNGTEAGNDPTEQP